MTRDPKNWPTPPPNIEQVDAGLLEKIEADGDLVRDTFTADGLQRDPRHPTRKRKPSK
jgi:hypothetical protein